MPFTPLHAGPGILAKSVLGDKFHFKTFMAVNILLDIEPGVRMFLDMPGDLHQLHNPLFASVFMWSSAMFAALMGVSVLSAFLSALFGVVSHLWLDAIYHADVAAGLAAWGISVPRHHDAEFICLVTAAIGVVVFGIRKLFHKCFSDGIRGPASRLNRLFR